MGLNKERARARIAPWRSEVVLVARISSPSAHLRTQDYSLPALQSNIDMP